MSDDLLIQHYIDGALNGDALAAFNQRLREDAALRDELRDIAEQAVAMGDLARSAAARAVALPVTKTPRAAWAMPWALAASIALLAAVGAGLWMGSRETPVLTLVEASGSVAWSRGGEWRTEVSIGERLTAGTIETVGETATAQLRFADGTLITLTGESELSFSEAERKLLVLRKGSLSAQVKAQPPGHPMLVRTASAEAEVIGTVFNLAARRDETWLNVDEGLVKLKRLADGSSVDVPARSSAVASLDSAAKLNAATTPAALTGWSFDFATTVPPRDWRGVYDGEQMVASPYVASRKSADQVITHFGVSVRTGLLNPPLALIVTDTSVIRYRLRQAQPGPLQIMLLTADSRGGYGGNFEVKFNSADFPPDRDGWCDVAVPISRFVPVDERQHIRDHHPSPVGNILTSVLVSSFRVDTGLSVSRFNLLQD
jgi:hypothetical protein